MNPLHKKWLSQQPYYVSCCSHKVLQWFTEDILDLLDLYKAEIDRVRDAEMADERQLSLWGPRPDDPIPF